MKARGEIPIIIFCAEDDEAVLAKVVDELRREGLAPELVPGVEFDGNLLTAAVDGAAGETLFVLCGSATIDKAAVRRLTGLFSARCGPGHRIISTQLTPSRPLAVMPAIRGAIKEMRLAGEASESDEPVPESTTSHLRDVVEAFADPPPRRVPARPPAERPATREPSRPVQSAAPAVRETPPQTAPAATPRRSAPASSDASPQAVVNDDVVRSIEQRLAAVPAMPDSLVSTDPSASGLHARRAPPAGESSGRRPVYDEPRGNRMLLVFAGVGIAGILALALMQLLQPSPSPATGTRAPAKANAPEKAEPPTKAPETKVATPPPETKVEPPPDAKVEPPPDAKVEPPPDAKVEPPPPDVPPAPVAVSRRDRDLAALELGRSEGKVDKLGSLWVVKGSDDDGTWEDAQRKCGGRRVNGVHGFRLPGLRELKKIRAAGVIASGNYWTRDKREADEAIAYDAGSGTTNVYLTIEPNARAICVRVL